MVNNDGTFEDNEIYPYVDKLTNFLREQNLSWLQTVQLMKLTIKQFGQYIIIDKEGKVTYTWK